MLIQPSLSNFLYVEKMYPGMVKGTILFLINWITVGMHLFDIRGSSGGLFSYGINMKKKKKTSKCQLEM